MRKERNATSYHELCSTTYGFVSGDCSAKRPNESLVCGVEVVGRCEGNNREDEMGVLSVDEISGESSNVQNTTCETMTILETTHTKKTSMRKRIARVMRARRGVLFTPPVAYKGIAFPVSETPREKIIKFCSVLLPFS